MIKLNFDDVCVQKAIEVFYNPSKRLTGLKIYTKLRLLLWKKCRNIEELNQIVDKMIELYQIKGVQFRDAYNTIMVIK